MMVSCHDSRLPVGCGVCTQVLMAVWSLFAVLPTLAGAASAPILLGALTRAEVEEAMPDWVEDAMAVQPDLAAADRLPRAMVGAEVVIYLGTWCDDSRRELARLWWAVDSIGIEELPQLTYVGVDRSMAEPAELLEGVDLIRVPTVVVRRQGVESGRIVEESPHGIEEDLLALLTGEASGTLTASEDLLNDGVGSDP